MTKLAISYSRSKVVAIFGAIPNLQIGVANQQNTNQVHFVLLKEIIHVAAREGGREGMRDSDKKDSVTSWKSPQRNKYSIKRIDSMDSVHNS